MSLPIEDLAWPSNAEIPDAWARMGMKIGLFILNWSFIDQQLDLDILLARARTSERGSNLAVSFGNRLIEWRKTYSSGFLSDPEIIDSFFNTVERANRFRNDIAHNIISVGCFGMGETAWLNVSRPNRSFEKDLKAWLAKPLADPKSEPMEFTSQQVPEHELDLAMGMIGQIRRDVITLGKPIRREFQKELGI